MTRTYPKWSAGRISMTTFGARRRVLRFDSEGAYENNPDRMLLCSGNAGDRSCCPTSFAGRVRPHQGIKAGRCGERVSMVQSAFVDRVDCGKGPMGCRNERAELSDQSGVEVDDGEAG